jgi:hypothetical protein
MITKEVIKTLYKKYNKRAKSLDCLDIAALFDNIDKIHGIKIDMEADRLEIGSIESSSLFHTIHLSHIHAIVPFEEWTAIILHSAIIFLNHSVPKVSVHIKPLETTLAERIRGMFFREKL